MARVSGGGFTLAELAALVDSRWPDVISLVGFVGLLVLLWLLLFEPFRGADRRRRIHQPG